MFYDYLAIAIITLGVGDFIWGFIDDSDAPRDETATPEPETVPETGDMTDELDPDSETAEPYVAGPTTVTVETDGETTTTTFDDTEFGVAPTVSGTEFRDTITASDETGLAINLDAAAGDDFLSFGFGASVDPGTGSDVMSLNVTQNALASENGAGTIDMTDTNDSLTISFEDATPEFMHTVRGQSFETVDGVTIQTDWIDYYASDNADLSTATLDANTHYAPEDATRVLRVVIGEGTEADPAEINADPAIILNRTISSSVNLTGG